MVLNHKGDGKSKRTAFEFFKSMNMSEFQKEVDTYLKVYRITTVSRFASKDKKFVYIVVMDTKEMPIWFKIALNLYRPTVTIIVEDEEFD